MAPARDRPPWYLSKRWCLAITMLHHRRGLNSRPRPGTYSSTVFRAPSPFPLHEASSSFVSLVPSLSLLSQPPHPHCLYCPYRTALEMQLLFKLTAFAVFAALFVGTEAVPAANALHKRSRVQPVNPLSNAQRLAQGFVLKRPQRRTAGEFFLCSRNHHSTIIQEGSMLEYLQLPLILRPRRRLS